MNSLIFLFKINYFFSCLFLKLIFLVPKSTYLVSKHVNVRVTFGTTSCGCFLLCISRLIYLSPYSLLVTPDSLGQLQLVCLPPTQRNRLHSFFQIFLSSSNLIPHFPLHLATSMCSTGISLLALCLSSSPLCSLLRSHTTLDATLSPNTTIFDICGSQISLQFCEVTMKKSIFQNRHCPGIFPFRNQISQPKADLNSHLPWRVFLLLP